MGATVEQLQQTPEIGPVLAESVRSWMDEPRNRELLERLRVAVSHGGAGIAADGGAGSRRAGGASTYVITGTPMAMTRDQAEAALKGLGQKSPVR